VEPSRFRDPSNANDPDFRQRDSSPHFERDASSSRQAVPGSRAFCLRLLPGRRGASVKREAANCAFELTYGRMFERRVGLAQLAASSAVLAAEAQRQQRTRATSAGGTAGRMTGTA
jgi:hypothetical protein